MSDSNISHPLRTSGASPAGSPLMDRREFARRMIVSSMGLAAAAPTLLQSAPASMPDLVVFSKVYQGLKLDFDSSAALTAEAGLQGVDAAVRPGGEVLPEKVGEDLPRYAAALKRRGLTMPLMATSITGPTTPHTEAVLRAARKAGVSHYRLGWETHQTGKPLKEQLAEVRARLKDLAVLNREIGIGAIYQNHSPMGAAKCIGGDLDELFELLEGLDPSQVGAAFDIGHALAIHGDGWRERFLRLVPHIRIVYVKDLASPGAWVPLGRGRIGKTNFIQQLREMGYTRPISLHLEHDWDLQGKARTRENLLAALKADASMLRRWLSA